VHHLRTKVFSKSPKWLRTSNYYHRQLENKFPLEDWQFSRSKLLVGGMGIHSPITSLNGLRLSAQTVIESLNPGLNHLARHPKQHEKTVDHPPRQDGKILRKEDHPTVNFHQSEKASIFFEAIQNIFFHTFSSRKAVEEKSAVGGRLKIHSQPSLRS
jgi:hypothetical protein